MSIGDARDHLPAAVETARTKAVFVERRGRPAGCWSIRSGYEQLMAALEAVEDAAAFDAAEAEEGPNIPGERVEADLGWVIDVTSTTSGRDGIPVRRSVSEARRPARGSPSPG